MEKINELKMILNDWKVSNNVSVLKDLMLEYIQIYELIKEKIELGKIDEDVYSALFNYYKHIKKYEIDFSVLSLTKEKNNIYDDLNLEDLLTRLEKIREDLYKTDKDIILDDNLLEILSKICLTAGEELYNKIFSE